jgi:toxin HigB-1
VRVAVKAHSSPLAGTLRDGARLAVIVYRYTIYAVIRSFGDKDTAALFEGHCPRQWLAIRAVAERKLIQLHAAASLDFLRVPPGNRLELLKGDRAGQWSIRISDRWRVYFRWNGVDALDVEVVDYH